MPSIVPLARTVVCLLERIWSAGELLGAGDDVRLGGGVGDGRVVNLGCMRGLIRVGYICERQVVMGFEYFYVLNN